MPIVPELQFRGPLEGDRDLVIRLLGGGAFKSAIWDWQFGGRDSGALPVVACHDGQVVGFNGVMPVDIVIDGSLRRAHWSCDFVVAPEWRRHGVGKAVKKELDARCELLMTLGTSAAAAAVLPQAGWVRGAGPRLLVRLQSARGVREHVRRLLQSFAQIYGAALGVIWPREVSVVRVSPSLPSASDLDALWQRCQPGYQRCVVRDGSYLSWRYAAHPLATYQYAQIWRQGTLVAVAVFTRRERRVTFVDYVGPADDRGLKRKIVEAFISYGADCAVLECTTSDAQLQRELIGHGFLPTAAGPMGFFVRSEGGLPADCPGDYWFLMGGDSDGEILAAARDAAWQVRWWTEEDFRAGRASWQALLEASDGDRVFMGWDWQHCWWHHFSSRHAMTLRIAALYDHRGKLAGLAPFFSHGASVRFGPRLRRLCPIGGLWAGPPTMRSEYLGLVLRPDVDGDGVARLWRHLLEDPDWDDMCLPDWVPNELVDGTLLRLLRRDCTVLDYSAPGVDESRYVPLQQGFQGWLDSLSANARRSTFNRRRYLESLGTVSLDYAAESDVSVYLDQLNALHATRWGSPVFVGHRLAFHVELASRFARRGLLRLSRLSVSGVPRSVVYSLRGEDHEYNLQMGFDDAFYPNKLSLGLLHLGYEIERAAKEGTLAFDLLAGGGKHGLFKHRFAQGGTAFVRRQYLRALKARAFFVTWHAVRRIARREEVARIVNESSSGR